MKAYWRYIFLGLCILSGLKNYCQEFEWDWARSAGGLNWDRGLSIATDTSGNVFVAGYAYDTIIFQTDTFIAEEDNQIIFLVKYDSLGNELWARSGFGHFHETAYHIKTDLSGNIYLTGNLECCTAQFDGYIAHEDSGAYFLIKYNPAGEIIWLKEFMPGHAHSIINDIAVDTFSNSYITGFSSADTLLFGLDTLVIEGLYDPFLVKFDVSGNEMWAIQGKGQNYDKAGAVAVDNEKNVYLTGTFNSEFIVFENDTLFNYNAPAFDIYFVKLNANTGKIIWAINPKGNYNDEGTGLVADNNRIYMTGNYSSASLNFGNDTIYNIYGGDDNIFVVCFDSTGNEIWAKDAGGNWYDYANDIVLDNIGDLYIIGSLLSSNAFFDSIELNCETYEDVFLAKYDSETGAILGAGTLSGTEQSTTEAGEYDIGYSIACDKNNNIYITGLFSGKSIIFDSAIVLNNLSEYLRPDFFVAKSNGVFIAAPLIIDTSESIKDILEPDFYIIPNPVSSLFRLGWNNMQVSNEQLSIQLFNLEGRLILEKTVHSNDLINIFDLSSGIYILEIMHNKQFLQFEKLMKM